MSLSIANLTRRFDQTEVLRGIDLDIRQGELVALLGPSGSGKTTLLRIIAGLDWPDAGSLTVGGQDWLRKTAQERRTGFVFQHYALFPHMKVRDNIAFGLTVLPRRDRPSSPEIAEKVRELLHFLQIDTLADRYPTELSGGQRQRVALGRALAISPQLLLLDEPFGALDAQVRRDLRRWLRGVHEASQTTTIFVTHDQEEAFELADRVVVMGAGRIEQIGHPDEIYDHPASDFVARFVGLTVELPVTMRQGRAEAPGLDLAALPRRAMADGPATLFLRPSDIAVQPDPAGPFHVTDVASTGALLRITLQGPGDCRLEAEVPRRTLDRLELGQTVSLRPEAGRLFPGQQSPRTAAAPTPISAFKEQRL
ncbi:sulfate transport system ATP-binding protein [Paracoccus alcaliphilus]|uniref:Sulfate transport system ATP-binding protein n=1 Tax=Paracoccus alcaliphilus TaxID=34002 RepID=A0A1H8K001_9RHOB|nr:sulfate/molybdate ABC transporter ATP-binding protein [Paracoccus alcaliphilus]WCR20503.1 sulfate/molybdate ABC transporter ATP-binding protein [Paracoccus alcaliphilus]SEN85836.1 sulfate transport system ATP-binding protein [Paracoccus alcaliphilus]